MSRTLSRDLMKLNRFADNDYNYDPKKFCGLENRRGVSYHKGLTWYPQKRKKRRSVKGPISAAERLCTYNYNAQYRHRKELNYKRANHTSDTAKDWVKAKELLKKNERNNDRIQILDCGRTYDPDRNCGVIDSEDIPCLRVITCKKHKIEQKRKVCGRSDNFEVVTKYYKLTKKLRKIKPNTSSEVDPDFTLVKKRTLRKRGKKIQNQNQSKFEQRNQFARAPETETTNLSEQVPIMGNLNIFITEDTEDVRKLLFDIMSRKEEYQKLLLEEINKEGDMQQLPFKPEVTKEQLPTSNQNQTKWLKVRVSREIKKDEQEEADLPINKIKNLETRHGQILNNFEENREAQVVLGIDLKITKTNSEGQLPLLFSSCAENNNNITNNQQEILICLRLTKSVSNIDTKRDLNQIPEVMEVQVNEQDELSYAIEDLEINQEPIEDPENIFPMSLYTGSDYYENFLQLVDTYLEPTKDFENINDLPDLSKVNMNSLIDETLTENLLNPPQLLMLPINQTADSPNNEIPFISIEDIMMLLQKAYQFPFENNNFLEYHIEPPQSISTFLEDFSKQNQD